MKRGQEIAPGVFSYSNGMIGTSDLPQFVAELAYRANTVKQTSNKQRLLMSNKQFNVTEKPSWKSQLADVYKAIKNFRRDVGVLQ